MQPIPETLEAIGELDPAMDNGSLLEQLTRMAALASAIAPDLIGVSVAATEHGITFTLVATDEQIAALDGVQYLTSGPCEKAQADEQGLATTHEDLLGEPAWHEFGLASAAAGVCSTLTFPIVSSGQVVGTVNLYGASDETFTGRHQELASVFGAWAPGAVANADLSFTTRRLAEQAPDQLRDQAQVDVATGIVAAARGVDVDTALEHLQDAARRAGVPLLVFARTIVEVSNRR